MLASPSDLGHRALDPMFCGIDPDKWEKTLGCNDEDFIGRIDLMCFNVP